MKKTRFFICVPVRNEAGTIGDLLTSIFSFELDEGDSLFIIIADNGSVDNTAEIARKALGQRGKVISATKMQDHHNYPREEAFRASFFYSESPDDIMCFFDADDSDIPSDWLRCVKRKIRKGYVAASGPYRYDFKEWYWKTANWFANWFIMPLLPYVLHAVYGKKAAIIIGGNFAATREALNDIGGIPQVEPLDDDPAIAMRLVRLAGPVAFTNRMAVKSSARRYYKYGVGKTQKKYFERFMKIYKEEEKK